MVGYSNFWLFGLALVVVVLYGIHVVNLRRKKSQAAGRLGRYMAVASPMNVAFVLIGVFVVSAFVVFGVSYAVLGFISGFEDAVVAV